MLPQGAGCVRIRTQLQRAAVIGYYLVILSGCGNFTIEICPGDSPGEPEQRRGEDPAKPDAERRPHVDAGGLVSTSSLSRCSRAMSSERSDSVSAVARF